MTTNVRALARTGGPVLISLLAVVMATATWGKWPDVLVDFGRELYVPWRITEGDGLYTDIVYLNGPLSPYVNALWFTLFGVSLRTLIIANLMILALMMILIYSLFLKIGGHISAIMSGLCVILLFAFNQYLWDCGNYNYVCPYSHDLTHGLVLSFASIWCFSRYLDKTDLRWILAMGCLIGLSFLTKPEVFLALAAAATSGLVLVAWTQRLTIRPLITLFSVMILSVSAPVLIAIALLSFSMTVASSVRCVAGAWPIVFAGEVPRLPQYQVRMGLVDPVRSLSLLGLSSAGYIICLAFTVGVSILVKRWQQAPKSAMRLVTVASGFLAVDLLLGAVLARWWSDAFRPLPIVLVLVGAATLVALLRARSDLKARRIQLLRLTMIVFALVLLFKILLYARIHHYGFALGMPATLLLATTFIVWLPEWLQWKDERKQAFRVSAINVCVIVIAVLLVCSFKCYAQKTYTVGEGPDSIRTDWRGPYVNAAIRQILIHVRPSDTLTVVPEGVMLNFFARRVNPNPYSVLLPFWFVVHGERTVSERFIASAPDWIYVLHRDCREFGYRGFGVDFGREIWQWIEQNYEVVHQIGEVPLQGNAYGMVLLRRRPRKTQY